MSEEVKQHYELVVLFRPELESKLDGALKVVADLVADGKGEIVSEDNWGRRELAYKIAGETHAVYRIYQLSLPTDSVAKLDSVLNITHEVIRHLITRVDEKAEAILAADKKARADRELARSDDRTSNR